MKSKRALILGISGQDGGLLSNFLINKGYQVHGTSRNVKINNFHILSKLGIKDKVYLHSINDDDLSSITSLVKDIKPDEIYNLSSQSSVGLSFEMPVETVNSILDSTIKILEAIRILRIDTKYFQASSSEMFGNTLTPADETTTFFPFSPYAIAKTSAHYFVLNYRKAYGIYACAGILFNHDSQFRPSKYVTQRIAESAAKIYLGLQDYLCLGNINIKRDWGWAEEYVEAMWLMLQSDFPDDYIIATGISRSLVDFVIACFNEVGLDPERYLRIDNTFKRPIDVEVSMANPKKIFDKLNWKANLGMEDVARRMTQAALERLKRE